MASRLEKIEARSFEVLYQELVALPDGVRAEILNGELIASPRPATAHAVSASKVVSNIDGSFGYSRNGDGRPGGWWILFEPELHLEENVLVPDVAGWRRERLPKFPSAPYLTLAPDWVCEVISPSTRGVDRVRKSHLYAQQKIPFFWLVDPLAKTLEVCELQNAHWVLLDSFEGNSKVRAKPFEAVELDLSSWWLEIEE